MKTIIIITVLCTFLVLSSIIGLILIIVSHRRYTKIRIKIQEAYINFQRALPKELNKFFTLNSNNKFISAKGYKEAMYIVKFNVIYRYENTTLLQIIEASPIFPASVFILESKLVDKRSLVEYPVTVRLRMSLDFKKDLMDVRFSYGFRIQSLNNAKLTPFSVKSLTYDYSNWVSEWFKNAQNLLTELKIISSKYGIYFKK